MAARSGLPCSVRGIAANATIGSVTPCSTDERGRALVEVDGPTGPRLDGAERHPAIRVGDHDGVAHGGQAAERVLQVDRRRPGRRDVDGAAVDPQHALGVEAADVAGAVPALDEALGLLLVAVPVALGHRGRAHLDQPPARVEATVGAAEPHVDAGHDPARAPEPRRPVVLRRASAETIPISLAP